MAKVVVLGGMGDVGRALVTVLSSRNDVFVDDLFDKTPDVEVIDFLHVCIPYSDNFINAVAEKAFHYKTKSVIIHSTVPIGKTRKVMELVSPKLKCSVFHAPVRGQHSDLEGGLRSFKMPVGGFGDPGAILSHLKSSGISCELWKKSEETELAKLLCLSRYLNTLAWYENASDICSKYGIDRQIVYKWTNSYNDGYYNTNYSRENLQFPNGNVGGTCVMPVSKMLQEITGDEFTLRNIKLFEGKQNGSPSH